MHSPTESLELLSLPGFERIALRWPQAGNFSVSVEFFGDEYADDEPRRSIELAMTATANPLTLPVTPQVAGPWLDKSSQWLLLHRLNCSSRQMAPTVEGKPIFENATLTKAVLAADTLAVVAGEGRSSGLWLLNVSDGAVLHQQSNVRQADALTLSPDGRWLARQNPAGRTVEVRAVNGGAVERLPNGGYHNAIAFHLSADALIVRVGRYQHRFWLNCVPFVCESGGDDELALNVVASDAERQPTAYDAKRFEKPVAAGAWVAAYDGWGQVVVLNRVGTLVLHVCVCRGQWAVVTPDGTRCGSAALLGGAPTPDAERLIGEWLRSHGR